MTGSKLACPQELAAAPELAVLALLDNTLQQTIFALFAAHPELVDNHTFELSWSAGPDLWLADAIYNQAVALQHSIGRYQEALTAARHRLHPPDQMF